MAKQGFVDGKEGEGKPRNRRQPDEMPGMKKSRAFAIAVKRAFELKINDGGANKLAEGLAKAARRAEKRNPLTASKGHEAAGDVFRRTRYDGNPENPLMRREAAREYRRAAELVKDIHPRRAIILERKAAAEERAAEAARPDPYMYVEHKRCPDVPEEGEGGRVRHNNGGLPDY